MSEREGRNHVVYELHSAILEQRSIFGVLEIEPMQALISSTKVSDVSGTFKQVLAGLLDGLRSKAASGDSLRKLAIGAANSTYFGLNALLQCTPDLDEQECSNCLRLSNIFQNVVITGQEREFLRPAVT
jgi:hypothetical protein